MVDTVSGSAGDEGAGWVTRAEMMRLTGKSEKTIKRDEAEHGLPTRTGPNGSVLVNVRDFVRIGRLRATDIPNGLTGSQAAEVLRLQEQVARLTAEKGELGGRLAEVREARDLAVGQIAVKDAQLKAKDEQIAQALRALARSAA